MYVRKSVCYIVSQEYQLISLTVSVHGGEEISYFIQTDVPTSILIHFAENFGCLVLACIELTHERIAKFFFRDRSVA